MAKNGFLTGYKHTGNAKELWLNYADYLNADQFKSQQVVRDRNLVTANGTATIDFTEASLDLIKDQKYDEISENMDLYRLGYYKHCEKYGDPFTAEK